MSSKDVGGLFAECEEHDTRQKEEEEEEEYIENVVFQFLAG